MTGVKTRYDHRPLTGFGLAVAVAMAITSAARADEPNPYLMQDNTWITIGGTVQAVTKDSFQLDYGDGIVTVEMDDGDRDADGYKLVSGDKVTVSGMVDDDLFETTTIEASSVYVENLGTTFFASAIDDEDVDAWSIAVTGPVVVSKMVIHGTVTAVGDDEFRVDSGTREIQVEVDEMAYNPLDDEGYQKIGIGDRVSVAGNIDDDLFEGRELVADSIVKLNQ